MLPILIPLAWLTVLTIVVAACGAAARADRSPSDCTGSHRRSGGNVLIVFETEAFSARGEGRSRDASCPRDRETPLLSRRPASRRRIAAHPGR